ncbi:MAG: glycosyltransferase family 4 protein [Akkermansiaceae bacterium]|nr:glycosyltransferase family 4 protein [Armatimonadota bacterium]
MNSLPTPPPSLNKVRRVLIATPVGIYGGAENVVLSIAQRLGERGITPIVAILRPGPLESRVRDLGIESVHVFPQEYRWRDIGIQLRSIAWLRDIIVKEQAQLVHNNHMAHLIGGPAAKWAGVPSIWHLHDPPDPSDGAMGRFQKFIPQDYCIFTTPIVQEGWRDISAKRPHSIIYPDCVSPESLRRVPASSNIRERYGISDAPFFIQISRIQSHKDHPTLFRAMARVLEKYPDASLVVSGEPTDVAQQAYFGEIKNVAETLGITNRIRYIGFVPEDDLVNLRREALALVHAAHTESYGLSLLEGMALGAPVIACAAEGPRLLVTDGENGLLAPVGDFSALATAMIRAIEDAPLRERLKVNGMRFAETRSVETMVDQTVAVYNNVL